MNSFHPLNPTNHVTWSKQLVSSLDEMPLMHVHWLVYVVLAAWISSYLIHILSPSPTIKAPFVGYRSAFEPTWFVRLRFVWAGGSIISEGYDKFKTSIFQVRKLGTDIVIIPPNYIDEVRKLSQDKTRSVEPFINDFAGEWVRGMVFLQSDLQNRIIQQRLTPKLVSLTKVMKDELDYALTKELPDMKDNEWVEVDIASTMVRIISRISARVFLGPEHCRNQEWLTTTAEYSESLFITGFILRVVPNFLRPFVAPLLPSYRTLLRNVASGRHVIGDIMQSQEAQHDSSVDDGQDILSWVIEAARGEEKEVDNIAQRMLILSLASIHTTAMTMTHAMYDLCARPEYFAPLREEVKGVVGSGEWDKTSLNRLHRLDSFLKESQRFNPIFLLTFNRIFHQSIKLSDGTNLPSGTRVAVPSHAMLQDSAHVPGPAPPTEFDGFRYSKIRSDSSYTQKYLFSMTDSSNMAFGYGKYACPGRFYASNEMKLTLAILLLRYELKLPDGKGRPRNITIDSDMIPDPRARLCIKRRSLGEV
ncbi:ent-kaurene oxidase [Fusarium beomiforme]|uniref:Ent-kaurene oxidase n=1 Tax=Fusarium beomiforme TaxID=44412 RepID=A0A9P5AMN2_9HYPO|nr:ent-kaurene oxidase [Fusarium beomiforme]